MKRVVLGTCLILILFAWADAAAGKGTVLNTSSVSSSQPIPNPLRKAKRWFKRLLGIRGYVCILTYANVNNLILSHKEIVWDPKHWLNSPTQTDNSFLIKVTTEASDPENDVLTYNYIVSAGKIIGQGSKVVWDLNGAGPGSYTIIAGVNDGCGVCGITQTRRVEVFLPDAPPLRETD